MTRSFICGFLLILVFVTGCSSPTRPGGVAADNKVTPTLDSATPIQTLAAKQAEQMALTDTPVITPTSTWPVVSATLRPTVTETFPAPSSTLVSETPTETAQPQKEGLYKVAEGFVDHIYWSPDSTELYFQIGDHLEQFNVLSGERKDADISASDDPESPAAAMPDDWPGYVFSEDYSPSGEKLVFQVALGVPIETLQAPADGEVWRGGERAALWLVSDGEPVFIGEMDSCSLDLLWSSDEELLLGISYEINRCSAHAFLIHLKERKIEPIFPYAEYPDRLYFHGFSADNQFLLYDDYDDFYLLRLDTLAEEKLEIEQKDIGMSYWLSDDLLLVSYSETEGPITTIGLYDLDRLELTPILDIGEISDSQGMRILPQGVSPNSQWFAFILAKDRDDKNKSLYVFSIPELSD